MVLMHFDCIERPLSRFFRQYGITVSRYPICFMIPPIIITLLSLSILRNWPLTIMRDNINMYTPSSGRASSDKQNLIEHFPITDKNPTYYLRRYEMDWMGWILVTSKTGDNVLEPSSLYQTTVLSRNLKDLTVYHDNTRQTYEESLCLREHQMLQCVQNPLILIFESLPRLATIMTYPRFWVQLPGLPETTFFVGNVFGGVEVDNKSVVVSAKSIMLPYMLYWQSEWDFPMALAYEQKITEFLKDFKNDHIEVHWWTYDTMQTETRREVKKVILLMNPLFLIVTVFTMITSMSLQIVRSKPWAALGGCASAMFGIGTSAAFVMTCGLELSSMVFFMPFIVFSIGVDDIYVLLSAWRRTPSDKSVEERMGHTFSEAGVSITVTSLTNILSFAVGCSSRFPSIWMFCVYATVANIFVYVYQMTLFAGIMAYSGRREENNMHPFKCHKVRAVQPPSNFLNLHTAKSQRMVAWINNNWQGAVDTISSPSSNHSKDDRLVARFFQNQFSSFLLNPFGQIAIMLVYAAYLAGAIVGILTTVKVGLNPIDVLPQDSYARPTLQLQEDYFVDYNEHLHVWFDNVAWMDINLANLRLIEEELSRYEHTDYSDIAEVNWIKTFTQFVETINSTSISANATDDIVQGIIKKALETVRTTTMEPTTVTEMEFEDFTTNTFGYKPTEESAIDGDDSFGDPLFNEDSNVPLWDDETTTVDSLSQPEKSVTKPSGVGVKYPALSSNGSISAEQLDVATTEDEDPFGDSFFEDITTTPVAVSSNIDVPRGAAITNLAIQDEDISSTTSGFDFGEMDGGSTSTESFSSQAATVLVAAGKQSDQPAQLFTNKTTGKSMIDAADTMVTTISPQSISALSTTAKFKNLQTSGGIGTGNSSNLNPDSVQNSSNTTEPGDTNANQTNDSSQIIRIKRQLFSNETAPEIVNVADQEDVAASTKDFFDTFDDETTTVDPFDGDFGLDAGSILSSTKPPRVAATSSSSGVKNTTATIALPGLGNSSTIQNMIFKVTSILPPINPTGNLVSTEHLTTSRTTSQKAAAISSTKAIPTRTTSLPPKGDSGVTPAMIISSTSTPTSIPTTTAESTIGSEATDTTDEFGSFDDDFPEWYNETGLEETGKGSKPVPPDGFEEWGTDGTTVSTPFSEWEKEPTTEEEVDEDSTLFPDLIDSDGDQIVNEDYSKFAGYLAKTGYNSSFDWSVYEGSIDDQTELSELIRARFLWVPTFNHYKDDIQFTENGLHLASTRFLVRLRHFGYTDQSVAMHMFQRLADESPYGARVFNHFFLFAMQNDQIVPSLLTNIALATGCVMVISLLLIPNPFVALWVCAALISINVGVIGYGSLINVTLDFASLTTIVMAVGFCVDYTAHVAYHFAKDEGLSKAERVRHAMHSMGLPITQSALSTIIGISVLLLVKNYVGYSFVKTIVLAIVFASFHGLFVLPVLLLIMFCDKICGAGSQHSKTLDAEGVQNGSNAHPNFGYNQNGHIGKNVNGMALQQNGANTTDRPTEMNTFPSASSPDVVPIGHNHYPSLENCDEKI